MTAGATNHAVRQPAERVLGIDFFPGKLDEAVERAAGGGLLTAPSGPGLAYDLVREPAYRRALESSDIVLTDSSFMVLLWRLRTGRHLHRNSGLAFLRRWMDREIMRRPGAVLWVMPSEAERAHSLAWLRAQGFPAEPEDFYIAPAYGGGELRDECLAALVRERRPAVVYLAIGGGVQERLGHHLREVAGYRPLILCLGAALAFMTGAQVHIAPWVDCVGLGWLWRILSSPARYTVRYARAARLAWLVFRYGIEAPPLRYIR